jgi:hypothetical protein
MFQRQRIWTLNTKWQDRTGVLSGSWGVGIKARCPELVWASAPFPSPPPRCKIFDATTPMYTFKDSASNTNTNTNEILAEGEPWLARLSNGRQAPCKHIRGNASPRVKQIIANLYHVFMSEGSGFGEAVGRNLKIRRADVRPGSSMPDEIAEVGLTSKKLRSTVICEIVVDNSTLRSPFSISVLHWHSLQIWSTVMVIFMVRVQATLLVSSSCRFHHPVSDFFTEM